MIDSNREGHVAKVWDEYWTGKDSDSSPDWDLLSELIYRRLETEIGDLSGKEVCEAGCGTGRISKRLHDAGANVTCLDITQSALELSRQTIGRGPRTRYVKGSILNMPSKGRYDVIWNAGVMEHFTPELQTQALDSFATALKPGGCLLLLTPFAYSAPYRVAKWLMERSQSWPYGPEVPVTSLESVCPPSLKIDREFTVTFFPFFADADKIVGALKPLSYSVRQLMFRLNPTTLRRVDRVFSGVFGGYLLLTVLRPQGHLHQSSI